MYDSKDRGLDPAEFGCLRVGNWYTGPTEGVTAVTPATPTAERFVCIGVHGAGTGGPTPDAAVTREQSTSLPASAQERVAGSPTCAVEVPADYGHAVVEILRAFVPPYDGTRARRPTDTGRRCPPLRPPTGASAASTGTDRGSRHLRRRDG